MSYVNTVLMPGETVIATARTHWFIYVGPALMLLVGAFFAAAVPPLGFAFLFVGLMLSLRAWIYRFSTELAVTNRRVIAKFGFIKRSTVELRREKVESLKVDQSILGRIFNFGSVLITGSGGTNAPIPYIGGPLTFRSHALAGLEGPESSAVRVAAV